MVKCKMKYHAKVLSEIVSINSPYCCIVFYVSYGLKILEQQVNKDKRLEKCFSVKALKTKTTKCTSAKFGKRKMGTIPYFLSFFFKGRLLRFLVCFQRRV